MADAIAIRSAPPDSSREDLDFIEDLRSRTSRDRIGLHGTIRARRSSQVAEPAASGRRVTSVTLSRRPCSSNVAPDTKSMSSTVVRPSSNISEPKFPPEGWYQSFHGFEAIA